MWKIVALAAAVAAAVAPAAATPSQYIVGTGAHPLHSAFTLPCLHSLLACASLLQGFLHRFSPAQPPRTLTPASHRLCVCVYSPLL